MNDCDGTLVDLFILLGNDSVNPLLKGKIWIYTVHNMLTTQHTIL